MRKVETARQLMTSIGYGGIGENSFVRHLTLRAIQLIGRAVGKVSDIGTGAYEVGNAILGRASGAPPDGLIEPIAVAMMPIMCFLVAYHLGPEWVILINYQTVQGLFCEVRKWRGRESERSSNEFEPQVMPLQATNPALPAYHRNPIINQRIENKAITAQATALHRGHAQ